MNKTGCYCIYIFIVLFCCANSEAGSLLIRENFENNTLTGWKTRTIQGAEGEFFCSRKVRGATGKVCYSIKRTNAKGELRLISPIIEINSNLPLQVCFRYQGNTRFRLLFFKKEKGKYIKVMNPLIKKAKAMAFNRFLKSEKWQYFNEKFELPKELTRQPLGMQVRFKLSGKERYLNLDDISITQSKAESNAGKPKNWLQLNSPRNLTAEEAAWYSPFPDLGYKYDMKKGVLTRSGRPYFYSGTQTVGGGQWFVASSWLARLQKSSFASVTWGVGVPMTLKKEGKQLVVNYKDTAPLYSWLRELARYGIITQFDAGNASFKYIPLKQFTDDFPQLHEFYVKGNHYYSLDHNTEIGRRFHFDVWKNYFKYIRHAPLLAFEAYNELGYFPSHSRVLKDFCEFARRKYGTLAEANRCWNKTFASWQEIKPPHIIRGSKSLSYSERLFLLKKFRKENMYYDWLIFLQQDLKPGLIEMKKDFRTLSDAPFSVDWRGHTNDFDHYVTTDLSLLNNVLDINYLHTAFTVYDYKDTAADDASVIDQLTRSLMIHNFVTSNTDKAIVNPEAIYSVTSMPGSNEKAMEKNSFGKFHNKWKFKLEKNAQGIEKGYYKPGFDDSKWGEMQVPGTWDTTDEYKGSKGWGWYRTTFYMPGEVKQSYVDGSRKFLIVGKGVAQVGTFWVNGHKVGTTKGWSKHYKFDISAYLRYGEENSVAILVDGTYSFALGLRFYFHILGDDMLNESRKLGKKEYASILWTNVVSACSGVSFWHFDDAFRPFMPELLMELNSVSNIVLPAARHAKAKIAMLMPYLYFRGIPFIGKQRDYQAYFAAMNFLHTPIKLLDEQKFAEITLEQYPFAVVPYATKVHRKTFENIRKYIRNGGFAVVTCNSLESDFDTYSKLPIEDLTGVKVTGVLTSAEKIDFDAKTLTCIKTEENPNYGVKITADNDVEILARFKDGSPAVTVKKSGQGNVCFVAGRLGCQSVNYLIGKLLERIQIKPDLEVILSNTKEFPYIQSRLFGTPERFVLYLHNWGGLRHQFKVKISREKLQSGLYRLRNVRGENNEERTLSANELAEGIELTAESLDPLVLLLEKESEKPIKLDKVSPLRTKILERIRTMNSKSDFNSKRPKVLFMDDVIVSGRIAFAVGRKLYPLVTEFMEKAGYGTAVLPGNEFTPEKLKKFKTIFLAEDISYPIIKTLRSYPKGEFFDNILDFVKNGGNLILVNSSGHPNSKRKLLAFFGQKLGFSVSPSFCRNPKLCGYGDPLQIKLTDFSNHPLTQKVKSMQMFVSHVFNLRKNSPMKPIAITAADDLNNPSKPVIIAGTLGKGKIVACADLLWLQPFRLEDEDNARFLMNMIEWTLGHETGKISRQELDSYIFINSEIIKKIEKEENGL